MTEEPKPKVQMITSEQLAERWAVSKDTVRVWRIDNVGPPWVKLTPGPKGAVRYRLSDIEEWERKMEMFQQPEKEGNET